ncbi:hypothetical protein EVAR_71971_1 [Eumeta japonica]|uniref:Uncharacterized protein n=1 Tax=Eumeta variegata TaxID=151549 RepID=A0A4C1SRE7_EUMVA|nr:hypothetical protein EVAR_71971_1 [Eumeta japonica]
MTTAMTVAPASTISSNVTAQQTPYFHNQQPQQQHNAHTMPTHFMLDHNSNSICNNLNMSMNIINRKSYTCSRHRHNSQQHTLIMLISIRIKIIVFSIIIIITNINIPCSILLELVKALCSMRHSHRHISINIVRLYLHRRQLQCPVVNSALQIQLTDQMHLQNGIQPQHVHMQHKQLRQQQQQHHHHLQLQQQKQKQKQQHEQDLELEQTSSSDLHDNMFHWPTATSIVTS